MYVKLVSIRNDAKARKNEEEIRRDMFHLKLQPVKGVTVRN